MLKIGDIYAGKPDAGDEIKECGYEEFANIFIHPTGVNIGRLASTTYGTPFFIMGDKGTGKTALLHFLEKHVCDPDSSACTSFISFERDFPKPQPLLVVMRHNILAGNDCGDEKSFVNIDTTTDWICELHIAPPF